jgi:hypothetical protein
MLGCQNGARKTGKTAYITSAGYDRQAQTGVALPQCSIADKPSQAP